MIMPEVIKMKCPACGSIFETATRITGLSCRSCGYSIDMDKYFTEGRNSLVKYEKEVRKWKLTAVLCTLVETVCSFICWYNLRGRLFLPFFIITVFMLLAAPGIIALKKPDGRMISEKLIPPPNKIGITVIAVFFYVFYFFINIAALTVGQIMIHGLY